MSKARRHLSCTSYLYARVGHYRSEVTAERNELLIAKNHPTSSESFIGILAISPKPARAKSSDSFLIYLFVSCHLPLTSASFYTSTTADDNVVHPQLGRLGAQAYL